MQYISMCIQSYCLGKPGVWGGGGGGGYPKQINFIILACMYTNMYALFYFYVAKHLSCCDN